MFAVSHCSSLEVGATHRMLPHDCDYEYRGVSLSIKGRTYRSDGRPDSPLADHRYLFQQLAYPDFAFAAVALFQPVAGDRWKNRLNIIGQHMMTAFDQGPGSGSPNQSEAGSRRQPVEYPGHAPAGFQQALDVIKQRGAGADPFNALLQGPQIVGSKHGAQAFGHLPPVFAFQQFTLGSWVRIAQAQAHQKAVQLGF